MSRTTWVILLAAYGMTALLIPRLGYSLPPCLGNAEGHIGAECMAHWESAMQVFPQRFVYVLGVPAAGVVIFFALAGITLLFDLTQRSRRRAFA